jgi:hypothetical protein
LEIGKKWKNEYRMKRNDSGTTFYSMPVTVEGWEEVEVPAGKFNALKVVNHGSYAVDSAGSSFSSSLTETFWYVPSVKRFVRREFIDPRGDRLRFELLEYAVQ